MTLTYEQLLSETLPSRIGTEEQYESICSRFGQLLGQRRRTEAPPDEATPAERLQFLLEHSGRTPADLLPIFGQRSHVHEALRGKRPVSAAQARKLGKVFHVQPGLFL